MFKILEEGNIFVSDGSPRMAACAGSRLAKLPDGSLICVFSVNSGSGRNDFMPMASYSADGSVWSEARPVWPELEASKSIFASVRNTADGRISLAGKVWDIAFPGEFWWSNEVGGMKENQLVFSISDDGESFPAPTFVDLPYYGGAEQPGGMQVDADGTMHMVYAPYKTIEQREEVDINTMVYLCSRDGGKTFTAAKFGQVEGPCQYAESWIARLTNGTMMVSTWQTASTEASDQYFLSFDDGKTFTAPMALPFRGQSTSICPWNDGTVLVAYNQRKESPVGVWLALGKPDAEGFHMLENQPIWQAAATTRHGTSGDFSEWTDFSFGEPHAIALDDKTILACLWFEQGGTRGIKYVRLVRE